MSPRPLRHQQGAALIALLAVFALGASWYLVSRLNDESNVLVVSKRNRNAEVLHKAKQALIGYVAAQAAKYGENRPGALPCPEAPADFDDPSAEGTVSYPCTLPVVGRFPWKSLGLDKLVDASGEPLWYAVAPGWAGASTVINSNCASYNAASTHACRAGRLTVDGVTDDVIAVLIAPGPPMATVSAAGCAAQTQIRPISGTPDLRNYLECENATSPADVSFVTTGPAASFNDQVVRITTADLLPALEAAIAHRIELEIVPQLKSVYAAPNWGLSGVERKFPFAAPFTDPASSIMQGAAGTLRGLLPMANAETFPASGVLCTPGASAPRCDPDFVAWSAYSLSMPTAYTPSCTVTATALNCIYYRRCLLICGGGGTVAFTLTGTASNVGMALRQLNSAAPMTGVNATPRTLSAILNASGSATMTLIANAVVSAGGGFGGALGNLLCAGLPFLNVCRLETFSVPINVFADHPLLDTRTSSDTGWFTRNLWHEVSYYAIAAGYAPSGSASCTTGSTCLSAANVTPSGAQRALLILAGRSINGRPRPSSVLADYLEFGNATGSFERQSVTSAPKTLQADAGVANAYVLAAPETPAGAILHFTALNANTGASTLSTPATGVRSLVNADGSNLGVGAIQANAAVTATFDGTQYLMLKRPYNDRLVVLDSN